MLNLAGCCRFSLEADARRLAVGTGSLEGRGMPDDRELVGVSGDWSILKVMLAVVELDLVGIDHVARLLNWYLEC